MKTISSLRLLPFLLLSLCVFSPAPAFSQSSGESAFGRRVEDTQTAPATTGKTFDFTGTRWKSPQETIELRKDGTWYSSWGNGQFSRWRKVSATSIRNEWHEWTLSDDKSELTRSDGARAKFVERIDDSEVLPEPPKKEPLKTAATVAPAGNPPCKDSPLAGKSYANANEGNSTYYFSSDGTFAEEWGGEKKTGKWWHPEPKQMKQEWDIYPGHIKTFTLSADNSELFRHDKSTPWRLVSKNENVGLEIAFGEELKKIKEEYEQAYNKAITPQNASDLRRIQELKKNAINQGNVALAEKIQSAENDISAGSPIEMKEPDRKNRPAAGELELYRIKTARDRAIDSAQRSALPGVKNDCEQLKRKALAAGNLGVAKKVDVFLAFESPGPEKFFGKWSGFGGVFELKRNFTCEWQGKPNGTWKLIGRNKIYHLDHNGVEHVNQLKDQDTMLHRDGFFTRMP